MLGYALSRKFELAVGMAAGACVTSAMPKANASLRGNHSTTEPSVFEPSREREASTANVSLEHVTKMAAMELASGKSWQEVAISMADAVALQLGVMTAAKVAGTNQNSCSRRRADEEEAQELPCDRKCPKNITHEVARQTPLSLTQAADRIGHGVEMETYENPKI